MQTDVRQTDRFRSIEQMHRTWFRPGENFVSEITDAIASPSQDVAIATGIVCDALAGTPSTRLVSVDLATGDVSILTNGPNCDRAPRWSPDGNTIAFLSDREQPFIFQLFFLDRSTGAQRRAYGVDGWVEYHHWSSDGLQLLLGVAGMGADLAGAQGGFSVAKPDDELPAWMPRIETAAADDAWRSAWIYDVETETARRVSPEGVNIWEARWCGKDSIVAICSDAPGEEAWYTANVRRFPIGGGASSSLYDPSDQLGWLSASPSGSTVAVVEAICSDRTIVAGDLLLIDTESGAVCRPQTCGADVTSTGWRGDHNLLLTAHRGPDNLILLHDCATADTHEQWQGRETGPGGARFGEIFPLGTQPGDCLFIREGWFDAPTLVMLRDGKEHIVRRFGNPAAQEQVAALGRADAVSWQASDGLEIQGWLLRPPGDDPHPLVLNIHGGPVWFLRPKYLGRHFLHHALLAAGYAVLDANPRGSSGRGQKFARRVFGDMGGADATDLLSGVDKLVADDIADPARLGLTGGSYGGFMSSWLITQDQRFAAAVPVAPVTNWVSEHLTCHIPYFCAAFLADDMDNPGGRYFSRSPVHHAAGVRTPTLHICGALDKNTPPGQALEFHHALVLRGVESVLLTYPQEGHGIRQMPASFDYLTRLVDWFVEHMPAEAAKETSGRRNEDEMLA